MSANVPLLAGKRILVTGGASGIGLASTALFARKGAAEEVGGAAAFLLSDLASDVAGAVLSVDGGWTAYGCPGAVRSA